MNSMNKDQSGFTILELMISTVVFSVLLLLAASMLVQIGRLYYKGVVSSRTQETTRTITDDIGRTLQFTSEKVFVGTPRTVAGPQGPVQVNAFCIGKVRYSYIINGQVNPDVNFYQPGVNSENYVKNAMWRDENEAGSDCAPREDLPNGVQSSDGREMLGEGMRLYRLQVPQDNNALASFAVGVVYGQDDELIEFSGSGDSLTARCTGVGLGAQWCATSELQTTVYRRID
jgi:prepilin-type N-terminal cleavage/methylation domain-containing protein